MAGSFLIKALPVVVAETPGAWVGNYGSFTASGRDLRYSGDATTFWRVISTPALGATTGLISVSARAGNITNGTYFQAYSSGGTPRGNAFCVTAQNGPIVTASFEWSTISGGSAFLRLNAGQGGFAGDLGFWNPT